MLKRLGVVIAAAAAVVLAASAPASAITHGQPDAGAHPYVGELLFFVPDEPDSRFDDPGAWFTCSGTLLNDHVVLTAGHCTYGVGERRRVDDRQRRQRVGRRRRVDQLQRRAGLLDPAAELVVRARPERAALPRLGGGAERVRRVAPGHLAPAPAIRPEPVLPARRGGARARAPGAAEPSTAGFRRPASWTSSRPGQTASSASRSSATGSTRSCRTPTSAATCGSPARSSSSR